MAIVLGILEEGLVYAIMALGVYITYSILDFPDLSVDSTFPLGGAVTVSLILLGVPPLLTLLIAFAVGAMAGVITGLIHVKLRVRDLLSGIIVMTGLYSVNLRLAGGKANVPIFSKETIFDNAFLKSFVPESLTLYLPLIILFIIVCIVKLILDLYMKTRSGYLLRAVGDNDTLVTSLAKDKGSVKIVGLAIANGLAALAGCVYCQQKGFFEISMGTGAIVIGLANVIIGTKLFKRWGFVKTTTAVVFGSIIYKTCISLAITFGLNKSSIKINASDLKLITSMLFLLILVVSNNKRKKVIPHA